MNDPVANHEGYFCQNGKTLDGFTDSIKTLRERIVGKTVFYATMAVIFGIIAILFTITQGNEEKYNDLRFDFQRSVNAIEKDILIIKGILQNADVVPIDDHLKKNSLIY